jgi:hypothetical protein
MAAEAAAHARADLAARGLIGTAMQDYYGMAAAARKLHNADLAVADAQSFLDITGKQERGGEVAHSDAYLKEHGDDGRPRKTAQQSQGIRRAPRLLISLRFTGISKSMFFRGEQLEREEGSERAQSPCPSRRDLAKARIRDRIAFGSGEHRCISGEDLGV